MDASQLGTNRFQWMLVARTTVVGVTRGAVFGALYGPISILLLLLISPFARLLGLAEDGSTTSPTVMGALLVLSAPAGMLYGAFIGLFAGIIAGLVVGVLFRFGERHTNSDLIGGSVSGLVALVLTILFKLPSLLTPRWPLVGWSLWVVIPTVIAFIAGWVAFRKIADSFDDRADAYIEPN